MFCKYMGNELTETEKESKINMDNDGIDELILCYPYLLEGEWCNQLAYGIYDIEQGKAVTIAENVTFGAADVAGNSGSVGVALYQGEPVFVTCLGVGETSKGNNAKYFVQDNTVKVYSYDDLILFRTLEVDTTANSISYTIDGKSVSEQKFQKEMEKFSYLEFSKEQGEIRNIIDRMKLDELIKHLKVQTLVAK